MASRGVTWVFSRLGPKIFFDCSLHGHAGQESIRFLPAHDALCCSRPQSLERPGGLDKKRLGLLELGLGTGFDELFEGGVGIGFGHGFFDSLGGAVDHVFGFFQA